MVNLKLALRTLGKSPLVTSVAILSLALGIGANTAIFSLFDQMLLRPLPVHDPGSLVNLAAPPPKPGSQSCNEGGDCDVVFSYPMFRDLESNQDVFTAMAAHRIFGANMGFRGQTLNASGMMVSGSYFPLLGVQPALGRLLQPADDVGIGSNYVAVLGHDYWTNRLGSNPAVLGEPIVVNGQPFTIVGIAPPEFHGTTTGMRPDVYVPISMRGVAEPGFTAFDDRRSYWAYVFARLKPGVTIEQASIAINALYTPIINDVEVPLQTDMSDTDLARFRAKRVIIEDGRRGQSSLHAEAGVPLILLLAVTGVVLLIACANIANLLLARAANRGMEMAIRLSLGASRGRLLVQLLVESCMIAVAGGILSLLVAQWTLGLIIAMLPAEATGIFDFAISGTVILYTGALALATGLLFGMFPALHGTRPDLMTTMRANTGQPSGARSASRFRAVLVTAQIALSMALLIPAGLFIRSLANVSKVELGIDIENLVSFTLSPRLNGYEDAQSSAFFARMEEELTALPGVTQVAAARVPVLAGSSWGTSVRVEGRDTDAGSDVSSRFNEVSVGYFGAMGMPLVAGREFTMGDNAGTPKVAIVNEAFARKFELGSNPVGMRMGSGRNAELDIEIVGVARDAKYNNVAGEIPPVFFRPYRQNPAIGNLTFYARTGSSTDPIVRAIPQVVAGLDANLPVENLRTMPQQVRENIILQRMIGSLAGAFAGLATLLAAVGLYGVLAHSVAQRTREIGLRMALGADARRVQLMILRQVGWMTLIGGSIGVLVALALGRAAQSLLFELQGHDPFVVAMSVVMLATVALGAALIPAMRASKVDPMEALRYE
jgi:predicted permease